METVDTRLVAALEQASSDLGFRLVSPFDAVTVDGRSIEVEGYLPDFGGPDGIVLVSFERRLKLGALMLPISILPKEYRKYRRKDFVSTLRDFGWHGAGARPTWFGAY
jgi:hypothetical protein